MVEGEHGQIRFVTNQRGYPQHMGQTFEAIVTNPPFSAKWSANKIFESDDRFAEYGRLAPASKADFAFVQHMLHHLDEDGTMAVILPHGVLFRGGAEGAIREFLIRRNWLDAVIGLPANIFYGTSIPTCILVLKKCKETEDVLFVDASTCFQKGKNQNVLGDEDVARIVDAYRTRAEEDRFSQDSLRLFGREELALYLILLSAFDQLHTLKEPMWRMTMCFSPLKESSEHLDVAINGLNLSLTRHLDCSHQGQAFQACLDLPVRRRVMQHLFDLVRVLLRNRPQKPLWAEVF